MPPATLFFWSLINGTMLEAGSLEIGGVEKELTSPASAVWTRSFCHRSHPLPIKVKCSRFGKQPCPVCQRASRKYHLCHAPGEKALVIALITTMALHSLVPATLSAKDCFRSHHKVMILYLQYSLT